jgi:hypothetical protein
LAFSKNCNELVSTHGYSLNQIGECGKWKLRMLSDGWAWACAPYLRFHLTTNTLMLTHILLFPLSNRISSCLEISVDAEDCNPDWAHLSSALFGSEWTLILSFALTTATFSVQSLADAIDLMKSCIAVAAIARWIHHCDRCGGWDSKILASLSGTSEGEQGGRIVISCWHAWLNHSIDYGPRGAERKWDNLFVLQIDSYLY